MNSHLPTINSLDAMPGAGKTTSFISDMVALISSADAAHIGMGVFPTWDLAREVWSKIHLKLRRKNINFDLRRLHILDPGTHTDLDPPAPYVTTSPVRTLEYLFGKDASAYASQTDRKAIRPLRAGDVVITTQEAYVRADLSHASVPYILFFDEARQCLTRLGSYDITVANAKELVKIGTAVPSIAKYEGRYTVRKLTKGVTHPAIQIDIANRVRECGDKLDFYIVLSNRHKKPDSEKVANRKVYVYSCLNLPKLFNGAAKVTVSSAFFESSQMFHLLKKDGIKIQNLLSKKTLTKTRQRIKEADAAARHSFIERVNIRVGISGDSKLKSGFLQYGALVPHDVQRVLNALEHEGYLKTTVAELTKRVYAGEIIADDHTLTLELRKYLVPPLWVLIDTAINDAMAWASQHLSKDDKHRKLLLAINKLYDATDAGWQLSGVPIKLPITQGMDLHAADLRDLGKATRKITDQSFYSKEKGKFHNRAEQLTPAYWKQRFYNIPRTCSVPATGKLHGLNEYRNYRMFAHLAAMNPDPITYMILNTVIGGAYDVDMDHVIDHLVQTLYRVNIRMAAGDENIFVFIPYRYLAEKLLTKIGVQNMPFSTNDNVVGLKEDGSTVRTFITPLGSERLVPLTLKYEEDARQERRRIGNAKGGAIAGPMNRKHAFLTAAQYTAYRKMVMAAAGAKRQADAHKKSRSKFELWELLMTKQNSFVNYCQETAEASPSPIMQQQQESRLRKFDIQIAKKRLQIRQENKDAKL